MSGEQHINLACRRLLLDEQIRAMPPDMRLVFIIRQTEGAGVIETAQATGLSPAMVQQLYAAAMQPMRVIAGAAVTGELQA